MAQIDSDIYFRNKGLDLGKVMDAYQEGVKLKDIADQRQKQKSIDDAYKAGVVKNPDGTFKQDRGVTLSKIAEFDPRAAMEQEAKWKTSDYEDLTRKRDEVGKFAGFVANVRDQVFKDPSSYPTVINQAKSMGYDVSMMPQQYGPDAQKMIETFYSNAIGAQKQIDNQFNQKELELKEKNYDILQQQNARENWFKQQQLKQSADEKKNEGQKVVDKEFAKDYNDWTSGGGSRAKNEIEKIDGVIERLKKGEGTTGGLTGVFGDRLTSDAVLKNRADIQQSAMSLIKQLLSGATSDSDRKAIVDTLWNEADSTENNIARIERFSDDMKNRANEIDSKAGYFKETKGTLSGFDPSAVKKQSGAQIQMEEKNAALQWAKQNPSDPRAKKILETLK